MRNRLIRGLIGSAIVVSISGFTAAPAAAQTEAPAAATAAESAHGWSKGTTTLVLEPTTLNAFTAAGIAIRPLLAEATAGATTSYAFDVVGDPADGTTELLGGIQFREGRDCLLFTHLVIDAEAKTVTGRADFATPTALFTLGGATSQGVALHFTAAGATAFNEALGVTSLRPGRILGYHATVLD